MRVISISVNIHSIKFNDVRNAKRGKEFLSAGALRSVLGAKSQDKDAEWGMVEAGFTK